MKISYLKTWDSDWYVVNQKIRSESEKENKFLKKCFTEFTKKQKWNEKLFSIWLIAIDRIIYFTKNKRIKNKNTFVLLF